MGVGLLAKGYGIKVVGYELKIHDIYIYINGGDSRV